MKLPPANAGHHDSDASTPIFPIGARRRYFHPPASFEALVIVLLAYTVTCLDAHALALPSFLTTLSPPSRTLPHSPFCPSGSPLHIFPLPSFHRRQSQPVGVPRRTRVQIAAAHVAEMAATMVNGKREPASHLSSGCRWPLHPACANSTKCRHGGRGGVC